MPDSPKISVIMSVWNNAPYLAAAIESILQQSFTDFEFIILDDKGQDTSGEIIARYDDSRIRVIDNGTNLGLAGSLNQGLSAARGTYIAIMDGDDVALPDRLAVQVAYMDAHPEVVTLSGGAFDMTADGTFLCVRLQPTDDASIRFQMLFTPPFYHPACMFRSAIIQQHQLRYDPALKGGLDSTYFLLLAQYGQLANLHRPLLAYRLHPKSISHVQRTVQADDKRSAARIYLEALINDSPYDIATAGRVVDAILDRPHMTFLEVQKMEKFMVYLVKKAAKKAGLSRPTLAMKAFVGERLLKTAISQRKGLSRWVMAGFILCHTPGYSAAFFRHRWQERRYAARFRNDFTALKT